MLTPSPVTEPESHQGGAEQDVSCRMHSSLSQCHLLPRPLSCQACCPPRPRDLPHRPQLPEATRSWAGKGQALGDTERKRQPLCPQPSRRSPLRLCGNTEPPGQFSGAQRVQWRGQGQTLEPPTPRPHPSQPGVLVTDSRFWSRQRSKGLGQGVDGRCRGQGRNGRGGRHPAWEGTGHRSTKKHSGPILLRTWKQAGLVLRVPRKHGRGGPRSGHPHAPGAHRRGRMAGAAARAAAGAREAAAPAPAG